MDSPFMQRAAQCLARCGLEVYRFEFEYMRQRRQSGRRPPPSKWEKLRQEFSQVYAQWQAPQPHYLGGKSLGSRVALSLVSQLPVAGGLALGYPFHPPGQPQKVRLEPLQDIGKPCLIFQGSRDPFGRPDEVRGYPMDPGCQVIWLDGADHGFEVPRSSSLDPFEIVQKVLTEWLSC